MRGAATHIGFLVVGFGSLDLAVKLSIGRRALGRVANNHFFLPITKSRIACSASLLSSGR
jgi:hypothetical protein